MRLLALALCALPSLAMAQGASCADHDTMKRHLAEGWGETRQAIALDAGDSVVELDANPETGTWTLTLTRPGGPTCMMASGSAFEAVGEGPEEEGDPA